MAKDRRLSATGAALIANFEGFRSCPYRDAVGVWTIGYGSTKGVGPGTKCLSRQEALARMKREVNQTYGAAVNRLPVDLNQNQFDALTSFVYNVGTGGIGTNTGVGKALRKKQWDRAANELLRWNKAGGRTLAGLTRRRKAERKLFLTEVPPPKIKWSDAERREIRKLTNPKSTKKAKAEAKEFLRGQISKLDKQAATRPGGWERYDRGRRRRGISRLLEGKDAEW